ncbi:MAG: PKD domain-containing protein, partial [Gemmatimonadota bacterium]|nr:PKD domain-containing protein [Gemmatimonadota bacterium]
NQSPVAMFTYLCVIRSDGVGADCAFNGSASTDSDGTIVAYTWTASGRPGKSGPNASFAYKVGTSQTVSLVVTDNQGATGTKAVSFTVGVP